MPCCAVNALDGAPLLKTELPRDFKLRVGFSADWSKNKN
jgi:hypothetical protein